MALGSMEPMILKVLGRDASEGCIRLHNEDLQELRSVVKVGTVVEIKD